MRVSIPALLAVVALSGPAWATDGPVATAGAAPGAPTPAAAAPPAIAPDATWAEEDVPTVVPGPCGPTAIGPDGRIDTRPHGEIDVGVGTDGYRHIRVSACKPLGQTGAIAVSISRTEADWRRRR